ncbi:hypothetical protein H0H92_003031 [Tricholoma furcatifolium]|nr:hypothetical protein H0H92_003031 [Tricholoma furcatifolium]
MSASARAEARRKAILSRGSDRLAKLTTSARGDDPAYSHDDPPLPTIPTPPKPAPPQVDPSVWSETQQQQLLQALLAGSRTPEPFTPTDPDTSLPPMDNPFAAMLASAASQGPSGAGIPPSTLFPPQTLPPEPKPPTRFQRLMPFVHLITVWSLLAYFVLYTEPRAHADSLGRASDDGMALWKRWAELGRAGGVSDIVSSLRIQVLPFFWAFTTVQILLHSLRIFSGFDTVSPPTLVAVALPHLPPPLPSLITNALKYLQMGSLFLDDLAGLLVGIGFIILFSGWFTAS